MSATAGESPGEAGPLPEPVRGRVAGLAADALGSMTDDEVPVALRPFRSWAPQRRRTRAAAQVAAVVERDVVFRQRVATVVRDRLPAAAAALEGGAAEAYDGDPVDLAALAYLSHAAGWEDLVAECGAAAERADAAADAARAAAELARLQAALEADRARHGAEVAELRAQMAAASAEAGALAKSLREEKGARRRAERVAAEAGEAVAAAQRQATEATEDAAARVAAAAAQVTEAEAAIAASRRAVREGRSLDDVRARLLLDTVVGAADALRRELALPPVDVRPADLVPSAAAGEDTGTSLVPAEDPAVLDRLVALPQAHLIVDGYNVTKTGFPELSLEDQRARLLTGLSHLAARSGAEVTCCFDGAALEGRVPAVSARGVRVLFSEAGETADELIRRLVRAEPEGRPVAVVSSDREVADGVRRAGARPVAAIALVRRLARA